MKQHKMTKEFKSELEKLLVLAVELNRPDFTVFARFSGHVCHLEVSVHFGGWRSGSYADESRGIYVNDFDEDNDSGVPNDINEVKNAIKWLIEASPENESRAEKCIQKEMARKRAEYERLKAEFEPETTE